MRNHLKGLDEDALLAACDIHPARIDEIVEYLSKPSRLLSFLLSRQPIKAQAVVDKNVALINLHLQLGEVGRRGAGPFSLTGQPNAMGGRRGRLLVSPDYRVYRVVTNDMQPCLSGRCVGVCHREALIRNPGLDSGTLCLKQSAEGKVRALLDRLHQTPHVSMPDTKVSQEGLRRADLGHRAGLLLSDRDRGICGRAAPRCTVG